MAFSDAGYYRHPAPAPTTLVRQITPPRLGAYLPSHSTSPLKGRPYPTSPVYGRDQSTAPIYNTGSAPAAHQPPPGMVRSFSVLLTDRQGNKWHERDIACSRVSDLKGILQSRIGIPIQNLYFQGQPLSDTQLAFVPSELKLEADTSPSGFQPPMQPTLPSTLTLFVEDFPRRLTFEASSLQDLLAKMNQKGIQAKQLLYKVHLPNGDYTFEPLQNLSSLSYEHHVKVVPQEGVPLPPGSGDVYGTSVAAYAPQADSVYGGSRNPSQAGRHVSRAAGFSPAAGINIHRVMVEAGQQLMSAMPNAEDEDVATATARVTQQFKQEYQTSDNGREPSSAELAFLRSLVDKYLMDNGVSFSRTPSVNNSLVPQSKGSTGAAQPPSGQSVFKCISFGIAGAFPVDTNTGQQSKLKLVPPPVTMAHQPVVLLVNMLTDTLVNIRCTLGYENEEGKILVINLDEYYSNGWISIGKTSPTSLFLSFQPDVLREGVHFYIDVAAFLADKPSEKYAAAQTDFIMRDAENTIPNNTLYASSVPPKLETSSHGSRRMTLQDQLRDFAETKVLPLYGLSWSPKVSSKAFHAIVDDACKDFWSLPPDTKLTEEHKQQIITKVKQALMEATGDA
eukprot:Sspe_Gene.68674::Locus_40484_Transcript_1_3_Confidence_0.600_Length_2615::g.68674::m.68674